MERPARTLTVQFWQTTSLSVPEDRHFAVEVTLAIYKVSGCCSFTNAVTAMLQDLRSCQKTERNMLAGLIRLPSSVKKEVLLNAFP